MNDRPLSQLLKELMFNCSALVRSEIKLAAAEARENALQATRGFARAAGFFGIAYFGAIALLAFTIIGLGELLQGRYWLSSLLIGLILGIPGILLGLRELRELSPENTFTVTRASLHEDEILLQNTAETPHSHPPGPRRSS